MSFFRSPALTAWMSRSGDEVRCMEVLFRPRANGFELRHIADAHVPDDQLQELVPENLRDWAQTTDAGAFRPNKAAPGLRRGWRCEASSPEAVETALDGLYPGALADWHAVQTGSAVPSTYREFTGRQTGMYRDTSRLDDASAARMIRAACHSQCCLRRRLWTVTGLEPDTTGEKSDIPCLEPCALLLEFARRAVRWSQEPPVPLALGASELATLRAAVEAAIAHPDPEVREGDAAEPGNVRRLLLLRERLRDLETARGNPGKES